MQTDQETQSALERRIDMTVPMAEIEKDVEARLKRMAPTVKMAGFRPGKVPLKIVAQTYGGQARSEAIGAAVERAFSEKLKEEQLRVAGQPRIEPQESEDDSALAFSAVFEIYPEVVPGEIAEREIQRPVLEVGDAEIDKTIDVLRQQRTTFETAERAAAEGDRVTVDFLGRKDGEEFEGGKATDFPFVVGSGSMLKDFDTAVVGMAAGESKNFEVTFPEDYRAEELAGKTVQFEVTMKGVEAPKLPEIDSEFVQSLGVADGDVSKLRAEVKGNLEREVKRRIQARIKEQVMDALLETTPLEVPRALIDTESNQLAENARRDMEARGMDMANLPVQASWFTEQAERRVKLGLIMAELVKQNDLYATPTQIREMVEDMAQSYEDPQELVQWYYSDQERLAQVEAVVVEDNVVAWALDKAKAIDAPVAFDELMGNEAA